MSRGAAGWLESLWARNGAGALALTPVSWLYALAVGARNAAYDLGILTSVSLKAPTVSIGNLTVGGTGKTPVSAWVAGRLHALGLRPGILLRGYGDDEPLVHGRLTPEAVVVANPDRIAGAAVARSRGARALVLDDAFQYRRAARDLDIVLVAAEQGRVNRRLPAGPMREGPGALTRADILMVTRKTASIAVAEEVARRWAVAIPDITTVIVSLTPSALLPATGSATAGSSAAPRTLAALQDARVLAISAIGDHAAFEAQLARHGARVDSAAFPDHHAFTDAEVAALVARAAPCDLAICTLKDAVKLEGRWPREGPALWYVSQAIGIERGAAELDVRLRALLETVSP